MANSDSLTAVVQGALMKGLASNSKSFATIGISGRSARKHYGIDVLKRFDAGEHDFSRR